MAKDGQVTGDLQVCVRKTPVYVDVNADVNVNVNDVSLQPGPALPRTFELFASVRGGGQ